MTTLNHTYRIVRLEPGVALECLARLYSLPVDVAESDQVMWLRCNADKLEHVTALKKIPGEHYRLAGDNLLIRDGCQVADAILPTLDWQPLEKVVQLDWPVALEAGRLSSARPTHWQLVRGGQERLASAVVVTLDVLRPWVDTAPQWRLDKLKYIIAHAPSAKETDDRQVHALVIGQPLPPLPCQYLVQHARVLIPAGMEWLPRLDVSWVMRSFNLADNQFLIWLDNHQWSLVDQSLFRPLHRSSLRAVAIP